MAVSRASRPMYWKMVLQIADVDMLEQEVQESIEAVQEQFCREGRIWQESRYRVNTVASKLHESTNGRIVRGRKRNKDSANALESHLKSKVN